MMEGGCSAPADRWRPGVIWGQRAPAFHWRRGMSVTSLSARRCNTVRRRDLLTDGSTSVNIQVLTVREAVGAEPAGNQTLEPRCWI